MHRDFPTRSRAGVRASVVVASLALTAVAPRAAAQNPPVPVGQPPVTGVGGDGSQPPAEPSSTIAPVPAGSTTVPITTVPIATVPPAASSTVAPGTSSTVAVASSTSSPPSTRVGASTTSTTLAPSTPDELRKVVLSALANAGGDRSVMIMVDGAPMVDSASTVARPPASTQKVYTAGAALSVLGPTYRFVTSVRASGPVGGSVLTGDLVLVASGDPTLSSSNLTKLATDVAAAGVRTVTGRLLVDDSHFDRTLANEGWKKSFVPGEVGPLSAFLVDGNHRADTLTLTDPALANLTRFRAALTKAGVLVTGGSGRAAGPVAGTVVASRTSAPLSDIVSSMVKRSDNTYAEAVLKELGAAAGSGSAANGLAQVTKQLDRYGIARPVMADGSGLSSLNRSNALTMTSWLSHIDGTGVGPQLRASLPIACVDGTLRNRMCGTPAAGNVVAKTGSLDNVVALAGYARTASGRRVVFSILLSNVPSSSRARVAMDRAVVAVASYRG